MTEPLATTSSRPFNHVFFSLFRTRGPSATGGTHQVLEPHFFCFVVPVLRENRPLAPVTVDVQGEGIHPFLSKSVPLIHYPYSSIASMGLFCIFPWDGMASTWSWTQKTGWDPLNFWFPVSWIQLRPSYDFFLEKLRVFLGPLRFFPQ